MVKMESPKYVISASELGEDIFYYLYSIVNDIDSISFIIKYLIDSCEDINKAREFIKPYEEELKEKNREKFLILNEMIKMVLLKFEETPNSIKRHDIKVNFILETISIYEY